MGESQPTKILFVEEDERSFEVRQCVARVLQALPPVQLFHAKDATEALSLLDQIRPDVIVLDGEVNEEKELFIDSLHGEHPPVVIRTEQDAQNCVSNFSLERAVNYIPKNESLEGIHQTLLLAAAIGHRNSTATPSKNIH